MSGDAHGSEQGVDVLISYDHPEHVATIRSGMGREVPPPRILDPTLGEVPQLLLAGSISIRLLVGGLIEWTQKVRGITLVCKRNRDGTIDVAPDESENVRRVIVEAPDGEIQVFDSPTSQSAEIEAAIRALNKSSGDELEPG